MKNNTGYRIAIAVIFGVLGIWFYFTPYIAMNNIKKAAEANDSAALSSHINFPSLKESLKSNFNAILATKAATSEDGDSLGRLGMVLAAAFISPMVDALVTPENLARMMQGNKPNLEIFGSTNEKNSNSNPDTAMTMGYESFDIFSASVKKDGHTDYPVTFVLHREGLLTWKLASLRLPTPETKERQAVSPPQIQQNTQPQQIANLSKYVGLHASEVFNNPVVQEKFKALLANEHDHFLANLRVASRLELKGNFYMGSGSEAPTQRGVEESAFAINKETGEVFACILSDGAIKCYGVTSQYNLPAPLHDWHKETERAVRTGNLLATMYRIKEFKKLTDKDVASCGLDTDNENLRLTDGLLEEVISCLRLKEAR